MKNVIVTGASGGMGKATCELLISKGYNVFGLDYGENKTEKLNYIQTDVTNLESVEKAFEIISKQVSEIDAIIHFAGIYRLNSLIEMSEKEFTQIFDVNLFGVYRINKTFMPLLKSGSKIIITSSELAPLEPLPFTGIYAVTKTAIEKYAFSLRMELQLLGISVVVLRPGAVNTGLLPASTKELDKFCNQTKLYECNAKRFKDIVNSVETKNVSPSKIANLALKIVDAKKPKYVYNINRNFKLKLLNALPKKWQTKIIKAILTK
ncbi:MAG: SDR family NAD(P)-dependent oxidoreductase [Christensenellales bacterium]